MAKDTKAVVPYGYLTESNLEVIKENLGEGVKLGPFDLPRIKVPSGGGKQFEIPSLGDPEYAKEIVGVVIYWRQMRSYWKGKFGDGAAVPPDCSSPDGINGFGNPGGICARCPLAQFGSAENGAQACKLMRVLFTIPENSQLPYAIFVPPTSVRKVQDYFTALAGKGKSYWSVVSKFMLDQDKSRGGVIYSVIKPSMVADLPPEILEKVKAYQAALRPAFEAVTIQDEA